MLRTFLLIAVAAGPLAAETSAELFERASQKINSDIRRMPNYTCVQTVTRSFFEDSDPGVALTRCKDLIESVGDREKSTLQLSWVDRMHLDVAVSEGREIFSWAGDKRFQSNRNAEFADQGTIGNGDFAGFLTTIFGRGNAKFEYRGQHTKDGTAIAEFHYQVPLAKSNYTLRKGTVSAKAAFEGTVWLDPVSADLKRLTVSTVDTPVETGMCQAATAMEYQRVTIGKTSFLLPKTTELIVLDMDGTKSDNKTSYAACRQYLGESTIQFEDVATDRPAVHVQKTIVLPAGLDFDIRLKTPIDSDTMMAGDEVTGTLVKPLKSPSGEALLPRDAMVHGRLLLMQKRLRPTHLHLVVLRFDYVEFGDVSAALSLTSVVDKNGGGFNKPGKQELKAIDFQGNSGRSDHVGAGLFAFPGDEVKVRAGVVTHWKTRRRE